MDKLKHWTREREREEAREEGRGRWDIEAALRSSVSPDGTLKERKRERKSDGTRGMYSRWKGYRRVSDGRH